jgi:hypothetical protein
MLRSGLSGHLHVYRLAHREDTDCVTWSRWSRRDLRYTIHQLRHARGSADCLNIRPASRLVDDHREPVLLRELANVLHALRPQRAVGKMSPRPDRLRCATTSAPPTRSCRLAQHQGIAGRPCLGERLPQRRIGTGRSSYRAVRFSQVFATVCLRSPSKRSRSIARPPHMRHELAGRRSTHRPAIPRRCGRRPQAS